MEAILSPPQWVNNDIYLMNTKWTDQYKNLCNAVNQNELFCKYKTKNSRFF